MTCIKNFDNEWPVPSLDALQINKNNYVTFQEIRNIVNEMKTGNEKVHCKRHWIVFEWHPYKDTDVVRCCLKCLF